MRSPGKGGAFEALLDALASTEKFKSTPPEQVGDGAPAKDAIRGTTAANGKEELKGATAVDANQTHVHRGGKKASRHAARKVDSRTISGSTFETKVAGTAARPEANDGAREMAESSAKLPNAQAAALPSSMPRELPAALPAQPAGDSAEAPAAPLEIVTAKSGDSAAGEIRPAAAEIGLPPTAAQGAAEANAADAAATKIAGELQTVKNPHAGLKAEQKENPLPAAGHEASVSVPREGQAASATGEARSDGGTPRQEAHAENATKLPATRKSSRDEAAFASEARKAHSAAEAVSTMTAISGANASAASGGTAATEVARDGMMAPMPLAVVPSPASHTSDSSNAVRESEVSASSSYALAESSGIAGSMARTAAGSGELKVSVHLSELGKVEIRAVATREATTTHVTASTREAVQALATERGELELALKSRDAILGSLDAQSGGHPAPQQHQQNFRSQAAPDRGSAEEPGPQPHSTEEEAENSKSLAALTSLNVRV
jgi:hypothetical protein